MTHRNGSFRYYFPHILHPAPHCSPVDHASRQHMARFSTAQHKLCIAVNTDATLVHPIQRHTPAADHDGLTPHRHIRMLCTTFANHQPVLSMHSPGLGTKGHNKTIRHKHRMLLHLKCCHVCTIFENQIHRYDVRHLPCTLQVLPLSTGTATHCKYEHGSLVQSRLPSGCTGTASTSVQVQVLQLGDAITKR